DYLDNLALIFMLWLLACATSMTSVRREWRQHGHWAGGKFAISWGFGGKGASRDPVLPPSVSWRGLMSSCFCCKMVGRIGIWPQARFRRVLASGRKRCTLA